jgi:HAD superfamily hydrolase (TIGR01509 family)
MDGLMLNTEDLYQQVSQLLMERRGKTYRETVRQQMIGLPAPLAFEVLIQAEGLKETWEELHRETQAIFEEILPTQLAAMPGLWEWLKHLDECQLPRCVATSSTREFAERALGQLGLLERVDLILTAADVPRGKPFPDIYTEAARRLSIDVGTMLVLEDSPTGTRAGVAAGAYVVSVPNAHTRDGIFEGSRWHANTLCDKRLYELVNKEGRPYTALA